MRLMLGLLMVLPALMAAATFTVALDGSQTYTVIQEAVDASADGDTVLVWPGRYYENVAFDGHNITLASLEATTGDEQYIHSTIIDGNQQGSCIEIQENGDNDSARVRGFTLTNGSGTPYYDGTITGGGGIYARRIERIEIVNCQIKGYHATEGGGLEFYLGDEIFLSGVSIHDNCGSIGGVFFDDEIASITFDPDNRCSIYNNWGGAPDLYCVNIDECDVVVDTFTVAEPQLYFANYDWFRSAYANHNPYTFDILHGWLEPVDHDLYVAPWGDDANNGLSAATPLKTIALALHLIASNANEPKTVYLDEGTSNLVDGDKFYLIGLKKYVNLIGKGSERTIIDANNFTYAVGMFMNQGCQTLQGFTVTGVNTLSNSTAIGCYRSSNVTFRDVASRNNTTDFTPGHYFAYGNNVLYDNVKILDNTGTNWYGGMEYEGSNVTIDGCLFEGNCAGSEVDDPLVVALNCDYIRGDLIVRNCVFRNNTGNSWEPYSYIALFDLHPLYESRMIIENNLFEGNDIYGSIVSIISEDGEAIISGNTFAGNENNFPTMRVFGNAEVYNNIFWNNGPTAYEIQADVWSGVSYEMTVDCCDIEGGQAAVHHEGGEAYLTWGDGNIDADPLFEEVYGWPYMLSAGSPCIDQGQPEPDSTLYGYDLGGNERVWDGDGDGVARMDMGCLEYQPMYAPTDLQATADGHCVVLTWTQPVRSLSGWRVYRDSLLLAESTSAEPTWTDESPEAGEHEFFVTAMYGNIETTASNTVTVDFVNTDGETDDEPVFALRGNYPNPFNPTTTIRFSIPNDSRVNLSIYNIRGQRVTTLVNENLGRGYHTAVWNGQDSNNRQVSSGVYFYRLSTGNWSSVKKMLLLK